MTSEGRSFLDAGLHWGGTPWTPHLKRLSKNWLGVPAREAYWSKSTSLFVNSKGHELYEMLEQVDKKEMGKYPVVLVKSIPQTGKKNPTLLRFSLQTWKAT